MLKKFYFFLFLSCISFSSYAVDGNKLYEYGREYINDNSTNYVNKGIYMGYIMGYLDNYSGKYDSLCISKNVLYGQIAEVVFNYLKNHPEYREQEATLLITAAIQSSWPCGELLNK